MQLKLKYARVKNTPHELRKLGEHTTSNLKHETRALQSLEYIQLKLTFATLALQPPLFQTSAALHTMHLLLYLSNL